MHRSGTSLVASLLRRAGVDLGSELLPAMDHNRTGHFEDLEFQSFHERALLLRDATKRVLWLPPDRLAWSPREREEAERLVRARRSCARPWGWKDPRTVLFLDEWRGLLPGAVFLLVFRHPAQVVDSLRRRRDRQLLVKLLGSSVAPDGQRRGLFRYQRAIEAWRRYNDRVLRFATAHPDHSILIELESLLGDPKGVLSRLQDRFDLDFEPVEWTAVFEPTLLSHAQHPRVARALAKRPEISALYAQLRTRAVVVQRT
jgi:hypothetical protein